MGALGVFRRCELCQKGFATVYNESSDIPLNTGIQFPAAEYFLASLLAGFQVAVAVFASAPEWASGGRAAERWLANAVSFAAVIVGTSSSLQSLD
jgi:hypothetical protein